MLITTQLRRYHLQNDRLSITSNEQNLQQVNQLKIIGAVVDENLASRCQWRVSEDLSSSPVVPAYKTVFTPPVDDTILQIIHNYSIV